MRKYKLNYNLSTLLLLAVTLAISGCQQSSSSLPPSSPVQFSITGIQPSEAKVGEDIIIVGTKFGSSQGLSTITLNGQSLTGAISSWSDTEIRLTVPNFAVSGMIQINTTSGDNSNPFQLVIPWDKENPENVAVGATGSQGAPQLVPDGNGGAIIVWSDSRNNGVSGSDIYAQRIDSRGRPLWENGVGTGDFNGIIVSSALGNQLDPLLVSDDMGGAIIVWNDDRNGAFDIYAQRIDTNGTRYWTGIVLNDFNGRQIGTSAEKPTLRITSDGSNGAIVGWANNLNSASDSDIYAQRVDAFGGVPWLTVATGYSGIAISNATGGQSGLQLMGDGKGGAILVWHDYRNSVISFYDIYSQRINSDGIRIWSYGAGIDKFNGIPISNNLNYQTSPEIVSDGADGAIIIWSDGRNDNSTNIYAQRINGQGIGLWQNGTGVDQYNGVPIATGGFQTYPKIISDDNGGAIIVWNDGRPGITNGEDIFAQRINQFGERQWVNPQDPDIEKGITISNSFSSPSSVDIIKDGKGGGILTWLDPRNIVTPDYDIYVQRLNSQGVRTWKYNTGADQLNGIPVSITQGAKWYPRIAPDKLGGAIIAWNDFRGGVYAQGITANGRQ